MMTITKQLFLKNYIKMNKEYAVNRNTKQLFAYSLLDNGKISIIEANRYKRNKSALEAKVDILIDRIFK
jgi:hypothetical protein